MLIYEVIDGEDMYHTNSFGFYSQHDDADDIRLSIIKSLLSADYDDRNEEQLMRHIKVKTIVVWGNL